MKKLNLYSKILSVLMALCIFESILTVPIIAKTPEDPIQTYDAVSNATGSGGGNDFESAVELTLGNSVSVSVGSANEQRIFSFTPTTTGFYTFQSTYNTGDPKAWLYNYNQAELTSNDDSYNMNFTLSYHLISGYVYYFGAGCYSTTTGSYNVSLVFSGDFTYANYTRSYIDDAYTVSNDSALEVEILEFIPPKTGNYLFYSFNATYDPKMWLYDSNFVSLGYDDDGAKNSNFRFVKTLTAGVTYYIVAAHYGTRTGSYSLRILTEASIPTDDYYLMNVGSERYLDIHGPSAQEYLHQWSFFVGQQNRWTFEKGSDGYYTIRSKYGNHYYVGIYGASENLDNIKLYSSISDRTKWKIYAYSTGELLIEPRNAPGTLLYAPNKLNGTELQLKNLSSLDNQAKWIFEVKLNTPLEGQQMSSWCWAASARMVSKYYYPSLTRTQSQAVSNIKGSVINRGGWENDVQAAIEYYIATENNASLNLQYVISNGSTGCRRYSENTLRRFLNDGHTIEITRSWYTNTTRSGGHCYAIVGYTSIFVNGSLQYRYILHNPWPKPKPEPWDTPLNVTGQVLIRSYSWICNGQNPIGNEPTDSGIWEGFVTVVTDYSNQTLMPVWNT